MTWVDIAALDDLSRPIARNGVFIGVDEGRVWAVEDRCTHAGCAFSTDGEVVGTIVVCDCHGSEFDRFTGDVLAPPADEEIKIYPTRGLEDRVEVDL